LSVSKARIKLDEEIGRSVIKGRKGFIYVDNGYVVVIENTTKTRFAWIRNKHFRFMELVRIVIDDQPLSTRKASVSGEFRLDRMPTAEEAKAIRKVLQMRQKRILTEEQKQALVTRLSKGKEKQTEAVA
jgi:hypothetical protein